MYQALGWTPPNFCHVGLLVDRDRQKLSKRNHDIGVESYRDTGILPSALLNFAVLLGWRPGKGHETGIFYELEELVGNVSFDCNCSSSDQEGTAHHVTVLLSFYQGRYHG